MFWYEIGFDNLERFLMRFESIPQIKEYIKSDKCPKYTLPENDERIMMKEIFKKKYSEKRHVNISIYII